MTRILSFAACLALAGCQPTGEGRAPAAGSTTPTPVGTPSTGTPTETGDTGTAGEPFDCATIPVLPTEINLLDEGPTGYHDLAFSPDGFIIGNNRFNQHLMKDDGAGFQTTLSDGIGLVQGMEWLPSGELAVASEQASAIYRVNAVGERTILTPGVNAYGVVMGPDGKLWTADNSVVRRHDLATGGSELVIGSLPVGGARVINFSNEGDLLYIGTFAGNGDLFQVALDENFDPIGNPEVLATGVGRGDYQDGLGVDVCGYLYVPDYGRRKLYRVRPDGFVQELYSSSLSEYGHGVEWGNGIGPWRTDAIYLPLPYGQNQVLEIVIGVPKTWDGPVLNKPSR